MRLSTPRPALAALTLLAALSTPVGAVDLELPLAVPHLDRLETTLDLPEGDVAISLSLGYDEKGRVVDRGPCTVGGVPVTVKGKVKHRGEVVYKLSLRGEGTSLKISGVISGGDSLADIKYRGPLGKEARPGHEVRLTARVATGSISVTPQVDPRGKITGTGTIASGYGFDDGEGSLRGSLGNGRLKWKLKVGRRQVAFKGSQSGDGLFVGTAKVKVAPTRSTLESFEVSGFHEHAPVDPIDDEFLEVRFNSVQTPLAVLENDSRNPAAHSIECVTPSTSGARATISEDGQTILYTAAVGFTGEDSFRYRVAGKEASVSVRVVQPDESARAPTPPGSPGEPERVTVGNPITEIRHAQESIHVGVVNNVIGIPDVGADPEYHKVKLTRGVTYRIELSYHGRNQPLIPLLRFYDYYFIRRAQYVQQGGTIEFEYEAQHSEDHFIQVLSDYTTTDLNTCTSDCHYEIRVDVIDDFRGDIPTNGRAGGTYPVEAELEEHGDVDLFSVEMVRGERYEFTVEPGSLRDISVALFSATDHDDVLQHAFNNASGSRVSVQHTALESQTHYIQVTGGSGTYSLVSAGGDIPGWVDTWATLDGQQDSSHEGNINRQGDADWYRVSLVAGQRYRLSVSSARNGLGTPWVGLFNDRGEVLVSNDELDPTCTRCRSRSTSLEFTPRRTGTYYASAGSSDRRVTGRYIIEMAMVEPVDPDADEYRDSAPANASIESHREPMYGALQHPGDQDWFAINLKRHERYTVHLDGRVAGGGTLFDPRLRLVAEDGTVLLEGVETAGGTRTLEIQLTDTSSNPHVVVDSSSGQGLGSYTLRREGGDPPGHDLTWAIIAPGSPVEGYSFSRGGDSDWYRLRVEEGHTYQIDAEGASTGMGTSSNPELSLLVGGSRDEIAADGDGGEGTNARLIYTAPADGIVFVSTHARGFPGSYWLLVTDLDASEGCPE